MLSWLLDKRKTSPSIPSANAIQNAPNSSRSDEENVAQALKDMNLLFSGTAHIAPSEPAELQFAERFDRWAKDCRTAFSDPQFDLPTLPASAVRVMSLMQKPECSSKEIARALQMDPVMTAKFLRMANSPIYAGTRRVESVQVAIDRLGMATVKGVVLAISLNSTVIKDKRLGAAASDLWTHSISAGLAAQELAKRLNLHSPMAFTLGLMHDIGKIPTLIMLNTLRAAQPAVRPELFETLLEDHHAEVGAALADVWNMPVEVRLIAGCHHRVKTLEETLVYIDQHRPNMGSDDSLDLAKLLGCVVLADRSLGALGLAREPGDLTVGESSFAADLGLSVKETMDYLRALPTIIKDSNMKDL